MIFREKPHDFKFDFEVVGCYCENYGKFLLLKRHKSKLYGERWNLPAGKVEEDETLENAIIREVEEETGIKLVRDVLTFYKTYIVRYPEYDYLFHTFKTRIEEKKVKLKPDEAVDYGWFTPQEALKLELVPDEDYCIIEAFELQVK